MIKKIWQFLRNLFLKPVYFVGSLDKLPEPLSKEEELFYIQKGDEEAKAKLIEHNLRLVVFLAKKYENTGVDLEDLVSIGTIGLIKGINTYNMDKNIKLATYASRCIDNEILMFLRKNKKRRSEVSFEDSLSFDSEGNELHLEDILGTEEDIVTRGLEEETEKAHHLQCSNQEQAVFYRDHVAKAMEELRKPADKLEMLVDEDIWPFPTYGELLFNI